MSNSNNVDKLQQQLSILEYRISDVEKSPEHKNNFLSSPNHFTFSTDTEAEYLDDEDWEIGENSNQLVIRVNEKININVNNNANEKKAWTDEEKKTFAMKREKNANEMRNLNLIASGLLPISEMTKDESVRENELEASNAILSSQLQTSVQQLAESARQLTDANALLSCEENKEKYQTIKEQQIIISTLRRQVSTYQLKDAQDDVLNIGLYQRETEKYSKALQDANGVLRDREEEVHRLEQQSSSQLRTLKEELELLKDKIQEKNKKIVNLNTEISKLTTLDSANTTRSAAASFLVEQMEYLTKDHEIKIATLEKDLIKAQGEVKELQSKMKTNETSFHKLLVVEQELQKSKMESRSEEVFEAYQLIRVLQPELAAKELKIVRLEESQF